MTKAVDIKANIDGHKILEAFGGLDVMHLLLFIILFLVGIVVWSGFKQNKFLKQRIEELDKDKDKYIEKLIKKKRK